MPWRLFSRSIALASLYVGLAASGCLALVAAGLSILLLWVMWVIMMGLVLQVVESGVVESGEVFALLPRLSGYLLFATIPVAFAGMFLVAIGRMHQGRRPSPWMRAGAVLLAPIGWVGLDVVGEGATFLDGPLGARGLEEGGNRFFASLFLLAWVSLACLFVSLLVPSPLSLFPLRRGRKA